MDMTKFTNADDPGFVAICGELRRWIRDTDAAERRRVPPSVPDSACDDQPAAAAMFGNGNRQFNAFGGTQNNVDGNFFEAKGDQYFGTIPSKDTKAL